MSERKIGEHTGEQNERPKRTTKCRKKTFVLRWHRAFFRLGAIKYAIRLCFAFAFGLRFSIETEMLLNVLGFCCCCW